MNNHECKCHHKSSGFSNGLVLGVIIGAALVFFFFTKRGKKIFQAITENGIESFEDLTQLIQNMNFEEEEFPEDGEIVTHKEPKTTRSASSSPRLVKRFFRGVKR